MLLEQGIPEILVYQLLDLYNHNKTTISFQDFKQLSFNLLVHLVILILIQHRLKSKLKINLLISQLVDQLLSNKLILLLLLFLNHLQNLSNKQSDIITIQQLLCIYLIIVHKFDKIFTFAELFFLVQIYQVVVSIQSNNITSQHSPYFLSLYLIKIGFHNVFKLELIEMIDLRYRSFNILILVLENIYFMSDYFSAISLQMFQQILSDQNNIEMIQLWTAVIIIGSSSAYFLLQIGINKTIVRKVYHLMAFIMFQQGTHKTPLLMYLSFGIAVYLFIMLELTRQQTQHEIKLVSYFDLFLKKFIDHRDNSQLIISHLFLLLGCSIPVLFFGSQSLFVRNTGILIMGIGDAFAAIVGKSVGYHRIGSSNKTWEGLLGCFISMTAVANYVFNQQISQQYLAMIFCISVVEALTQQIDNLILPFIFVQIAMLL